MTSAPIMEEQRLGPLTFLTQWHNRSGGQKDSIKSGHCYFSPNCLDGGMWSLVISIAQPPLNIHGDGDWTLQSLKSLLAENPAKQQEDSSHPTPPSRPLARTSNWWDVVISSLLTRTWGKVVFCFQPLKH